MKSKFLLLLALILSGGLFIFASRTRCAEAPSQIKISIDIPEICRDGGPAYRLALGNRNPGREHFFVVIENTSSRPFCIQKEDDVNQALHFEITADDGKTTTAGRTPLAHGKYLAYDLRLAPGEVTVCEIYYERDWDKFPFPHDSHQADQTRKVMIRAVFEQSTRTDAVKPDHWTGKAASKAYEVLLEDNAS